MGWEVYCNSGPTSHVLATWKNEFGMVESKTCKIVMESPQAYRLVAPGLKLDVLKSNTSSFMATEEGNTCEQG